MVSLCACWDIRQPDNIHVILHFSNKNVSNNTEVFFFPPLSGKLVQFTLGKKMWIDNLPTNTNKSQHVIRNNPIIVVELLQIGRRMGWVWSSKEPIAALAPVSLSPTV